jgi:hypothetical protein
LFEIISCYSFLDKTPVSNQSQLFFSTRLVLSSFQSMNGAGRVP